MKFSIFLGFLLIFVTFLPLVLVILEIFESQNPASIIDFSHLECQKMFDGDPVSLARGALFKFDDREILAQILKLSGQENAQCAEFQKIFGFFQEPTSQEELEFPLAYGMLVHGDFVQLSLLLSAIYQPQNQFCLAVDGNSSVEFIGLVRMLSRCYGNIQYFITDEIRWCGYEILTSVFQCVDYLAKLPSDWKYFQYLSGVDAPLKSNLEMIRILKALNGSFNAEILPFEFYRLNRKRPWSSPLPLYKTSLSATFSRKSANFMVNSEKVLEQIDFLRGTTCADESLWATIAGNPKELPMPGGFDAKAWIHKNYRRTRGKLGKYGENQKIDNGYYVSRYQQYVNRAPVKCKGYYYRLSCVFGVYDLPNLINRHELVAHKLYFSYQPAAFMCLVENSRQKSMRTPQFDFSAEKYRYENLENVP
ncbi:Beta-1,3-galactosyl-O-glycosyl-glycoprotein beta-1,6-N-acetylglucosaminyltransferase 3 [Caenorhabditis elegans]|uniref:Beta-1,3-galactosyl-O-glycosyl-glycoprotein beta-1,6-N-acetylglucosaminyltransferase 3 n=2 Tax=Caenorhabditis elegans TaxID=6239 RepID=G5EEZ8_CAEEL|nr:Beta-1,3-galactosyl-O-glycosyl-glycoprotein beta-1,6-N-acetylglucosaminyltransferase 3 [Caenorhabditis elegans]CAB05469.2 Beta-1,3-galactosyl-O-glycosyl-glycoprotein beta-1,6-N-acetylglucosaminyltransferase 3 [Caenorhabditis elegans]|eukprot:NP_493164.2 GLYcosylation related [Caenorhabditis elegans]